jgi:hypothetical protein
MAPLNPTAAGMNAAMKRWSRDAPARLSSDVLPERQAYFAWAVGGASSPFLSLFLGARFFFFLVVC